MERPEKVATPEATVTAEPPLRVPPAGLVPMARLTWSVLSEVSMLPLASSIATVTAGVMAAPAAVLEGPWTKASLVAGPGAPEATRKATSCITQVVPFWLAVPA